MKSSKAGKSTSVPELPEVEVLSIGPHGIWLHVTGEEHLLRYGEHPWFRDARVRDVLDVRLLHGVHLRWPALDVDLHIDSLREPERFPMVSRAGRRARRARPSRRRNRPASAASR